MLGFALFISAAAGLVLEITAARLIAPYVGMSLYTWTAIIAVVLAGMSAGHWIGGRLADAADDKVRRCMTAFSVLAAVTILVIPALLRLVAPTLLEKSGNSLLGIGIITFGLFFVPSLFIAALSPMLTRLAIDNEPTRRGAVLGRMFALGAAGSILGTVATGFFFISWIGTFGTLLCVAAIMGALAITFWLSTRQSTGTAKGSAVSFFLLGFLVLAIALNGRQIFNSACTVESNYYCIRIIDFSKETGAESQLMVLDHMGHGINERRRPERLHTSYVELTDRMARARFGENTVFDAFFIGGGAYTLPRAWQKSNPHGRLVVSEIDPEVTRAASQRMWFTPTTGTHIFHADARVVLQTLAPERKFDIIVGDAFHDFSTPQHLVTYEFAALTRRRLTRRGFLAQTVVDEKENPRFLMALVKTFATVFPAVEVWLDAEQATWSDRLTYLVIASSQRYPQPFLQSPTFKGRRWVRADATDIKARTKAQNLPVMTDDYAPVGRLMHQVLGRE